MLPRLSNYPRFLILYLASSRRRVIQKRQWGLEAREFSSRRPAYLKESGGFHAVVTALKRSLAEFTGTPR